MTDMTSAKNKIAATSIVTKFELNVNLKKKTRHNLRVEIVVSNPRELMRQYLNRCI